MKLNKKLFQKSLLYFVFLFALVSVLATVFIFASNNVLRDGVLTAKYFWFAASICIVSLFIPFQLLQKKEIHVTDVLFSSFAIYICVNFFCLNSNPDMHWWLALFMFPLYVAIRAVAGNEKLRQWIIVLILVVVLVQAI